LYSVFASAPHRSRQQGEPVRTRLHFALGELGQADNILACDLLIRADVDDRDRFVSSFRSFQEMIDSTRGDAFRDHRLAKADLVGDKKTVHCIVRTPLTRTHWYNRRP